VLSVVNGFDWDAGNREKCVKHGVTMTEIENLFSRPVAILPDNNHSATESRFKAIGQTNEHRFVLIVFTIRKRLTETLIRPISARYMHKKEVTHYEKALAQIE
jgi:uncharacterized DUF497 family protein